MITFHGRSAVGVHKLSALASSSVEKLRNVVPGVPEFGSFSIEVVYYVLGAFLGIVALYGLYRVVQWLLRSKGESFRRVIRERDAISILMHPNPDPDAMASAMAVQRIAEHVDTNAVIHYPGQIRRPENRAFRTVLGFDCTQVETWSDIDHPDSILLVDHNTPRGFVDSEHVEPIAVIDHHPGNGRGREFTDIREEYGATASILVGYLRDLDAVLGADPDDDETDERLAIDCELATGLTYGIQSDTKNLTRGCTETDFNVCAWLSRAIDEDLLHRITTPNVSHDVLRVKADAINNVQVDGSFGICNVGKVENVDALSQAVDELMRLEGTSAVVLYGINDGTVHLSARSKDDRVHMGECIQQVVSDIRTASGGGHARMAGAQIPVGQMETNGSTGNPDFNRFNARILRAMNGEY